MMRVLSEMVWLICNKSELQKKQCIDLFTDNSFRKVKR